MPVTAALFLLGLLSLLAAPPFAAFASEIFILSAAAAGGHYIIFFLLLAFLSVVCVSLFGHTLKMFTADDNAQEEPEKKSKEKFNLTHAVMAAEAAILIVAGIFMFTAGGYHFFSEIAQSLSL